jgi:5-methylcytosine-specific restriction endonuclease McrA
MARTGPAIHYKALTSSLLMHYMIGFCKFSLSKSFGKMNISTLKKYQNRVNSKKIISQNNLEMQMKILKAANIKEAFFDYSEEPLHLKILASNKAMASNCLTAARSIIFNLRDFHQCMICGKVFINDNEMHLDHIIPISKFPCSHPWNIQALCAYCNIAKSDELLEAVPLFLKGAKLRTEKIFSPSAKIFLIKLLSISYKTNSILNEESILSEIINDYDNWNEIKDFLLNLNSSQGLWLK